jgi:Co/Zn/Cd efflux system component
MEQTEIAARRGIRVFILGAIINLFSVTKCLVRIAGHSFALFVDGIELPSDVASSSVVTAGSVAGDHPLMRIILSDGQTEPIAAVVGSLTLIAAGVATDVKERLRNPESIQAPMRGCAEI